MTVNKFEQIIGAVISLFVIGLFLMYQILGVLGFNDKGFMIFLAVFVVVILVGIFIFYKLRAKNNLGGIDYLNIGVQRHLLGLFMIFYGLPKLFGGFFDYQLFALDSKLGSVSEFELAWYFYGKNRWQELFSGIMEFIPGVMLLSRRTYYAGAIILLPVTAQVFILNFFFKIGGVTFPAACVLLACNLYILYSEKEKIRVFIKSLDFTTPARFTGKTMWFLKACKWVVILFAVFLVGSRVKSLFSTSNEEYKNLVGMYTLESVKKNNADYTPVATDSLLYKDVYIERQSRWNILRRFNAKTDAFVLDLNGSDSLSLYINKGGIGDSPDIKDEETVLKGSYKFQDEVLTIKGIQQRDTLQLVYRRQELRPKQWFW